VFIFGDETHSNGRIPWVTGALVLINILAFLVQKSLGESFTYGFSLVPAEIATGRDLTKPQQMKIKVPHHSSDPKKRGRVEYRDTWVTIPQYPGPFPIYLTLLTSMFLHADWVHLIGNMWFLVIFGRNVETALNHGRFLLYYLICGLGGGLAHVLSDSQSVIPCLGASGAISGIMGAYLAIYPLNKIKMWLGVWVGVIEVPAFVALGIWFLWQYVSAFASAEIGSVGGGVAYWDHLGGFATGALLIVGTIAYLKIQAAKAPPEDEEDPADPNAAANAAAAAAPVLEAADPFHSFLPADGSATPKPAPRPEPSYLPSRQKV
jgi:membrane associated rhomboid family serine protease